MTTFNTGNPVPSAAAQDRYDNSQVFDELMNGTAPSTPDRLGVPRQSYAGMEQAFAGSEADRAASFQAFLEGSGWSSLGAYAAGISITSHSQTVDYQGRPYQLKPSVPASIDAPYVTTGNWATEGGNFKLVGDNSLRQEIAAQTGSGMVGHNTSGTYATGTAGAAINAAQEAAEDAQAAAEQAVTDSREFASTGVFGNSEMLTRIRARISGAPTMYVLGDSISHGAFAGDIYRNGWVNLFRRMLYNEIGTVSYGYTPITSLFDPNNVRSFEVHEIDFTGTWASRDASAGSYVPQGLSWVSSTLGSTIKSTIPTFQDSCTVYYVSRPGGGTFDIKVNGTVVASVNTQSATVDGLVGQSIFLTDNRSGHCVIEVVTTSELPVEVVGFSYAGSYSDSVLHNFSISGRRLRWVDESVIISMLKGTSLFVMALGINDASQNETDAPYYAAFVQRIDWLIQYANQYGVPMIVPDFCWSLPPTNKTRMQLKRLADETQGLYIPFADFFRKGGVIADANYRINTLKLFQDESHPNPYGHKYIAETIAKRLGLSVTSKKQALDYHDWWMPLYLGASTIKNQVYADFPSRNISATRNSGSVTHVRLSLAQVTGTDAVQLTPSYHAQAGVIFDQQLMTQLQPENNGASAGIVNVSASGITVTPNAANTRSEHNVLVTVPRAVRPMVDGVAY